MSTTARLLLAASALLLLSGCVFAYLKLWPFAALLGVGSLGCFVGALNFKKSNDGE